MNEQEEKFISDFVLKEKRHRYTHLLNDPKKRQLGLNRLNGSGDLDPRYMQKLPSNADIAGLLKKEGCPKQVYIISCSREIDGKILPLEEALDLMREYGWGTIVLVFLADWRTTMVSLGGKVRC